MDFFDNSIAATIMSGVVDSGDDDDDDDDDDDGDVNDDERYASTLLS